MEKDDFFDPASLISGEDDEAKEESQETQSDSAADLLLQSSEEPHRLQDQFQDPLQDLDLGQLAAQAEQKSALLNEVTEAVKELTLAPDCILGTCIPPEEQTTGTQNWKARAELAEKLFQLVLVQGPFADLCDRILELVTTTYGVGAGAIFELNTERQEFFFRAVLGAPKEKLGTVRIPMHHGLVGEVADQLVAKIVNQAATNPLLKQTIGHMAGLEIQNGMAAPLIVADRLFGVIELLNKNNGFSDSDLQLFRIAAMMAAKVIEVRFLAAEIMKHGRC